MNKSKRLRISITQSDNKYYNPYIWLTKEITIDNSKQPTFDIKVNKNYAVPSKRTFRFSDEYKDIGRAIKPDVYHPTSFEQSVNMKNAEYSTICEKYINNTNKKYEHKKKSTRRKYYATPSVKTVDNTNMNVPTSEDAKVMKVLGTPETTLQRMEMKDYYGTRVGRKGQALKFIYNFDNWVQCRVAREETDNMGQVVYYYNARDWQSLPMTPNIKTIWTQKGIFVPVRFGTDVKEIPSVSAIIPADNTVNYMQNDYQANMR